MVYLSIILPAYNEENAIRPVVEDIIKKDLQDCEIIVVDDGSKDNTSEAVNNLTSTNVRLIRHTINKGKPEAIRTGIKNAKGSIVVLMDADYTYPAIYIKDAVTKINEGYDIVLGNRFAHNAHISTLNRIGNAFFSILIAYYTSNKMNDAQTGFRVFRREIFDKIDVSAKGLEYETKQTINALYNGYLVTEIPIKYRKRIGKSKLNRLTDGYRMFRAISSVVYANMSIQTFFFISLSAILFLTGVLFGWISLNEKLFQGVLKHAYYPIISTMAIVLSFQTFSLGIILDSLGRKLSRIEKRMNALNYQ